MDEYVPDIRQLGVFLKVVEEQGIGRAARALGVSQPHVSQEMKRLEERLGHQLIEREGRAIRPTADGEALLIFARSMFAVAERTRSYFSNPRVRGLIRIGLTDEVARTVLTSVLAMFMANHPGFRLEIETSFSGSALQRGLIDGRHDLIVGKCFGTCSSGDVLWREPIVWFGRGTQRGLIEDPIALALSQAQSEVRTIALKALHAAGRTWTISFQSMSVACLEAAVKAGFGVAPAMKSLNVVAGVRVLDDAGLPPLPDAIFFIDRRNEVAGVPEFEAVLREVFRQIGDR